eukprot:1973951-Pyramimonas_sp.AAC.1
MGRGLPPEPFSQFIHRRGSSLILPPYSGFRNPEVMTVTGSRMTRSDYKREVRAPQGRGSRLRLPRNSLTDEVPV